MSPSAKTTVPTPCNPPSREVRTLPALRWVCPDPTGPLTVLWGGTPLLLGRDSSCQVVLEGHQVSRRHAELRQESGAWVVRDLGSRNGIHLDGARVNEGRLTPGCLLRLGEWVAVMTCVRSDQLEAEAFHEIVPGIWAGPIMVAALEPLRRAAATAVPIVIEGETGTGKDGLAKAIHQWSGRKGSLVSVNCAAIPANLAEGELFGYRRGAFTGAERSHDGFLQAASRGTLFLDEVVELPLDLQPKLLRAIEQQEVTPLGESRPISLDFRLVAAVQEPLAAAVAGKRFRPDLHARLDGVTLQVPPLRQRIEEIPFLFGKLLKKHMGAAPLPALDPLLIESLCRYSWPYNVRELDRLAQNLVALHAHEPILRPSHLPERLSSGVPASAQDPVGKPDAQTIMQVLGEEGGNIRRAANRLLLSRQQLYRMLEAIPGFDLENLRNRNR